MRYDRFHLFYGGVFSQWYPSPFQVDGIQYNCAEQYMMAKKCLVFNDQRGFDKVMATSDPAKQKAVGRGIQLYNDRLWHAVARDVVRTASLAKFSPRGPRDLGGDVSLWSELMATDGLLLVEASPTDRVWGIGLGEHDLLATDPNNWRGTNWLGQVLTEVRESLMGSWRAGR